MVDVATLGINVDSTDLKTGTSNLNTFTAAGAKAERQTAKVGVAASKMGAGARVGAGGFRNLGLQLNQVAQVGGMTGNWMQAIAVQMPDMLLGFGSLGIAAGIAAGAMIPLIGTLADGGDEAEKTGERLDDLTDAVNDYKSAADLARASAANLTEQFGSQADEIKETLDLLQNIALSKALDSLNVSMAGVDTSRLRQLVDIVDEGKGEIDAFDDNFKRALGELQDDFKLTADEARKVLDALVDMKSARGPEEISEAARVLNTLMLDIYGTVQDIPPEFRDMAENAARADVAASSLVGAMEDAPGVIGAAASEAERLANWLGIALSDALALSSLSPTMRDEDAAMAQEVLPDAAQRARNRAAIENFDRLTAPKPKGRSGGGGAKVDPREREAQQIIDQTRTSLEQYNEEIANLNALQADGYLTEDQRIRAVKMFGEQLLETGNIGQRMGDQISDALADMVVDFDNARDAAAGLLNNLARMFASAAFAPLGDWFSGLFNADGNAFSGGRVTAFANGGVVSGPTMFPMRGNQTGLMGEAGPEAIMPLTRLANGKLGVAAQGGGSPTNVNITMNAPGADAGAVARMDKMVAELPNVIIKTVQTAQKRRML